MGQARGRIGMHKDGDYPNHSAAEVNFWLPVSGVAGNNSLFVESAEGRGDFQAVDMKFGELLRFHGYSCRHHTAFNDTGKTRLSFDLRAIPASCFPEGQKGVWIGDYPGVLVRRCADASGADSRQL